MDPAHALPRILAALLSTACGLAAHVAMAQCRIEVERARLPGVMVPAAGVSLDLEGVPLTLEPQMGKAAASLAVKAPLRFTATYPIDKIPFRLRKSINLYGGRIRLAKGVAPAWLGIQGDNGQISLQSTLGIEMKEPLHIPCHVLGLSNGTPYWTPAAVWPPKDRTVGTGSSFFPLYVAPEEIDPLSIRCAGPFRVVRKKPGWVLLEAAWEDGTRVKGWTRERNTTTQVTSMQGWGEGQSGSGGCGRSDPPLLEKVRLRAQAPIAFSPEGPVWAWVANALTVDAFADQQSDDWIQVAAVPGLLPDKPCSEHEHIWVHARDVLRIRHR